MQGSTTQNPAFEIPESHDGNTCSYCGRPFSTERQRDLHLGEVHGESIGDDQRAAYAKALDAERDDLWLYHFKAVVMLLVIYMATGLLYLIVLSG